MTAFLTSALVINFIAVATTYTILKVDFIIVENIWLLRQVMILHCRVPSYKKYK